MKKALISMKSVLFFDEFQRVDALRFLRREYSAAAF